MWWHLEYVSGLCSCFWFWWERFIFERELVLWMRSRSDLSRCLLDFLQLVLKRMVSGTRDSIYRFARLTRSKLGTFVSHLFSFSFLKKKRNLAQGPNPNVHMSKLSILPKKSTDIKSQKLCTMVNSIKSFIGWRAIMSRNKVNQQSNTSPVNVIDIYIYF